MTNFPRACAVLSLVLAGGLPAVPVLRAQTAPAPSTAAPQSESEIKARALLAEAKAKMASIHALSADYEWVFRKSPTIYFDKGAEITLERPNKFKVDRILGANVKTKTMIAVCDGDKITKMGDYNAVDDNFIAYSKPLHVDNFFLGQNFLIQFFFDPRPITFDPSDAIWGKTLSLFNTNKAAYERDTAMAYLGKRMIEFVTYDVIQIKYNSYAEDIRQQIYIGADKLIYQVDTNNGVSEKFRHYRIDPEIGPDAFKAVKETKMPLVETDPVRLGQTAPDFNIPDYNGKEIGLKELLKGKKGLLICVLDGNIPLALHKPDLYLRTMKLLQELKNQFESQGLVVVCVYGGPKITPDMIGELKINGMPFVERFNYPIAFDVDIERGIQGSVFENFQLGGRNNILMDKDAKVVFAAQDFLDPINHLQLFQAFAKIGFAVSAADLGSSAR